eukprot:scaffold91793_cov38-Prasinocladus_malaysianus.AAC.2
MVMASTPSHLFENGVGAVAWAAVPFLYHTNGHKKITHRQLNVPRNCKLCLARHKVRIGFLLTAPLRCALNSNSVEYIPLLSYSWTPIVTLLVYSPFFLAFASCSVQIKVT